MSVREGRPVVIHVSTAHRANDVRIFERECRSLAATGQYQVYLAASGAIPERGAVMHIPLAPAPNTRVRRFSSGPRKALAMARSLDADLWHFHDPELLPVAFMLARSGQRVIWDAHEDYVAQIAQGDDKSWVPGPARHAVRAGTKQLLAAVDNYAAAVIAATPTIAPHYSNRRTVVVGNEARLEDFMGGTPDFASRRVLFTGHVGHSHLFPEVVEAIRGLRDVKLAVAGSEPSPEIWNESRNVLGDRIEYLGWLNPEGLAHAMSGSSLGLALYAPIPTYLTSDGSPTKVFEFGAAGLPVLGSPIPSVTRILGEWRCGFVTAGFTSQDIRIAIHAALADRAAWEEASDQGRDRAMRDGGWAQSEAELLRVYRQILGV